MNASVRGMSELAKNGANSNMIEKCKQDAFASSLNDQKKYNFEMLSS